MGRALERQVVVRMPAELVEQLERVAAGEERPMAWMVRRLLVEALAARSAAG